MMAVSVWDWAHLIGSETFGYALAVAAYLLLTRRLYLRALDLLRGYALFKAGYWGHAAVIGAMAGGDRWGFWLCGAALSLLFAVVAPRVVPGLVNWSATLFARTGEA